MKLQEPIYSEKDPNSPKKLKNFNANEKLLVTNFCALEFESETVFKVVME